MVFPAVMYGCESWTIKKNWAPKKWCFELWCWRRLLRVPWPARRSNQSILKEISVGVHWKDWCWSWKSNTLTTWCEELIWKDPDAGKGWGQEEKGATEDEMVGWHHWLNGHGFGWTLGVGDGQRGLACCDSWGRKESDMTERLNWTWGRGILIYLSDVFIQITIAPSLIIDSYFSSLRILIFLTCLQI